MSSPPPARACRLSFLIDAGPSTRAYRNTDILFHIPRDATVSAFDDGLRARAGLDVFGSAHCHPCWSGCYAILVVAGQCCRSNPGRRRRQSQRSHSTFPSPFLYFDRPSHQSDKPFSIVGFFFFVATTYISLDVALTISRTFGPSNPPQALSSIPLFVLTSIWPAV